MRALPRGKYAFLPVETRHHPCEACVGQQEEAPRYRSVAVTVSEGSARLPENPFLSLGIQSRTSSASRARSLARHQSRHPRSAELALPRSVPIFVIGQF